MKRLLCIVSSLNTGGAETFLMKVHRNLPLDKYQMDYCAMSDCEGVYEQEVIQRGGKVFHVESKSKNPVKCFLDVKKVVKENGYEYVMRVNEHSLSVIDLIAAKAGGAKVTVMRSTNANTPSAIGRILHKLFKFLPLCIPDVKLAPSTEAAEYTFGKGCTSNGKVHLLHNGLDCDKYAFKSDIRDNLRKELGIDNCFVIGHVGRFSDQKNHSFLIDVFEKVCNKNSNARLVCVGIGENQENIKAKVLSMGLDEKVLFLGRRTDVPELMSAFDVLLLPSLYEGMPNVVIEAQAASLPCVISDTITKEADITGLVEYVSLQSDLSLWADAVLKHSNGKKRGDTKEMFDKAGYTLEQVTGNFINWVFRGENV